MSRCEWNPVLHDAAQDPPRQSDCANEATLSVGYNGRWHLCATCAEDTRFRQLKSRVPLNGATPEPGDEHVDP